MGASAEIDAAGHSMTAGIPSLREQIEQASALAIGIAYERDSKAPAVMSEHVRQKIAASSSERGQARQAEVRERYMTALRSLGKATSRQLSDALGVTHSAAKKRMLELRRLGLVRDLGSIKQRIYEEV
jgi:predicted HTH transcriptional regulator